ncbi:MarR family winged helix-turn-helix transcriptional regulator [Frondihabitans cladoniiphilus]|uniref:MarR family transcriptional regulator n=1 Tax=Frondihabitans cladoniiphilus TaxID=715785 RepID=A0ABP8W914_9MICO
MSTDNLVDGLAQTSFVITASLSRIGAENDLSLTQLRVFGILRDRERLRMSTLADLLGLEKSSLSGLVDRAEQRGLVERAPNADDKRAVDVALTPSGQELATRVYGEVTEALRPWIDRLPKDDQHMLEHLLWRLLEP